MKSKISCWRFVRSIFDGSLLGRGLGQRTCVRKIPGARTETSIRIAGPDSPRIRGRPRAILPAPRGGGGIGRRARLRALWGACPVEVRVLFAASESPAMAGFFRGGEFRPATA